MTNKYNAIRTSGFASRGERDCYQMLSFMESAGEISFIKCQAAVYLTDAKIAYIADFKIFDNKINKEVWVEYKGLETPVWNIKKKLWKHYGPGPLRIYRGYGLKMQMTEEIIPK